MKTVNEGKASIDNLHSALDYAASKNEDQGGTMENIGPEGVIALNFGRF